jgi:hypothetical protein
MKTILAICGAILLAAAFFSAQEKPVAASKEIQTTHTGLDQGAAKPLPMQHEHHGFMQEGMHHAVAKGVTLDAKVDVAAHTVTLRIGPMTLAARVSPEARRHHGQRRAGDGAASRGVLEREPR